jgi:hypothetical protein
MKRDRVIYWMNKLTDKKRYPHLVWSKRERRIENIISKICERHEKILRR